MNYLNGSGRFDNTHGDEDLMSEEGRNEFLDSFQSLAAKIEWLSKTSWTPDGDDQDAIDTLEYFIDIAIKARK